MSNQTIRLSQGAIEFTYVRTVSDLTKNDITGTTIFLCLGTYDTPSGAWQAPDALSNPKTYQADVQMLIGNSFIPQPGSYYLWVQLLDGPEVIERRTPDRIVIA